MLSYHAPIDATGLRALGIPAPWGFGLADRVRFAEIDALGHVNNTAYLTWFESFRLPYLKARKVTDYGPDSPRLVVKRASVDYRAEMFNGMDYVVTGRTRAFRTTSFTMEFAVWLPDPDGATCTATGRRHHRASQPRRSGPPPDPRGRPHRLHQARRRQGRDPLIRFIFPKIRTAPPPTKGPPKPAQAPRTKATNCLVDPSFSAPSAAPVSTGSSASASSLPSSTPHWSKAVDPEDHPLHEDPVLVKRDDLAQHMGREPRVDQRRRRPVAREHPVPRLPLQLRARSGPSRPSAPARPPATGPASAPRTARGNWPAAACADAPAPAHALAATMNSHGTTRVPWWISW
jgi:acyl-CoA thioester hydrolase